MTEPSRMKRLDQWSGRIMNDKPYHWLFVMTCLLLVILAIVLLVV